MLYLNYPCHPISRYYPAIISYPFFTGDFLSSHDLNTSSRPWPADGGEYHVAEAIFWLPRQCHLVSNSKLPNDWDNMGTLGRRIMVHLFRAPCDSTKTISESSGIITVPTEKCEQYNIKIWTFKLSQSWVKAVYFASKVCPAGIKRGSGKPLISRICPFNLHFVWRFPSPKIIRHQAIFDDCTDGAYGAHEPTTMGCLKNWLK